jgi:hypothetical protein
MSEPSITVRTEREITADELSRIIGDDIIASGDGKPFGYLAGIALDGMQSPNRDVVDILCEFLENDQSLQFEEDEFEELQELLETARSRGRKR